jgi:hypothetical protein
VAEHLLEELGYPAQDTPPRRGRTPPPSPRFDQELDGPQDYSPTTDGESQSQGRSRSRSRSPSSERRLKAALRTEQTKSAEVFQTLSDLRYKFGRLRSRVIYLEGELAVYKRFAVIDNCANKPTPSLYVYPPPPPPPRWARTLPPLN